MAAAALVSEVIKLQGNLEVTIGQDEDSPQFVGLTLSMYHAGVQVDQILTPGEAQAIAGSLIRAAEAAAKAGK